MDPAEREAEDKALAEAIKAAHNERTKLTATYLNGLAVALVAVGGFAPMFSFRDAAGRGETDPLQFSIGFGLCIAFSGVLHLIGRLVLGRLR